jgi:hypothetical protein
VTTARTAQLTGRADPPSQVQLVTLTAACAWIALHAGHALVFMGDNSAPLLMLALLLAALAAHAVALAPLLRQQEPRLDRVTGLLLASTAVGVAAGVQPFLTPEGLTGFANWPMGLMGVLIAALSMRHRAGCAALAALGMTSVNTVAFWQAAPHHTSISVTEAVYLGVPPLTWWLGSLGVRSLLDRSETMVEQYRRRHLDFDAEAAITQALRESDAVRRTDLRARVLPLLQRLAEGSGPVDEQSRAEAQRIAASLRDDLKARSLLTNWLRDLVAQARDRGVQVSLSCDAELVTDEGRRLLELTRASLTESLPLLGDGVSVTCRVTGGPPAAVLVVNTVDPATVARIGAGIRRVGDVTGDVEVTVEEIEDGVMVHLGVRP